MVKDISKIAQKFETIYREFRLRLHKAIFKMLKEREGSLSATECFAAEAICLMEKPTITQFAKFLGISSSHAAYKVKTLIAKGYVIKIPTDDKRVYRLDVTNKFTRFYNEQENYGNFIMKNVTSKLLEDEPELLEEFLDRIITEINIQNTKEQTKKSKGEKHD